MKRPDFPLLVLLAGIFLAPIVCGKLIFDPIGLNSGPLYHALIACDLPSLSLGIVALLIGIGFCWTGLKDRIVMLPAPVFLSSIFLMWGILGFSIAQSVAVHESIWEFARWTTYILVMLSVVLICGRGSRVIIAAVSIVAGTTLVAKLGIDEYLGMFGIAPNWRIFSTWLNPNALAGLIAMVIPLGLALSILAIRWKPAANSQMRIPLGFVGAAVALSICFTALWLTASKGGLLACGVGIGVMVVFLLIESRRGTKFEFGKSAVAIILPLVLAGLTIVACYRPVKDQGGGKSRIFAAHPEAEQSAGFRTQLWKETIVLAKTSPIMGVGLGGYDTNLPRVSTIQGSRLAHNSYLQIFAETGVFGLLAFVAAGLIWLFYVSRGQRGAPVGSSIIRAGIIGAVVAGGADAMVESSFSIPGFSIVFFALLGLGLLLSSDGARPERMPAIGRLVIVVGFAVGGVYFLMSAGIADYFVGRGIATRTEGVIQSLDYFESAQGIMPSWDRPYVEAGRLRTAFARAAQEKIDADAVRVQSTLAVAELMKACSLRPTAGNYAYLAAAQIVAGQAREAEDSLKQAIRLAPSEPRWREKLFQFYRGSGAKKDAEEVALKIIDMESGNFYKYNALPQFVKCESVEPRVFMADQMAPTRVREEVNYLRGAYEILVEYRKKTYAELKRITRSADDAADMKFAGESLNLAVEKWEKLQVIAERLTKLIDDPTEVSQIKETISQLRDI